MSVVKFVEIKLADIVQIGNAAWAIATTPPPTLKEIQKKWEEEMRKTAQEVIDSQN